MEAVPRLPMVSFQLKVSPEPTCFATKLKQYIRDFYNEDPESYNTELHQLESLRASAVRPPIDVKGCELLKRYYCQLHFLQSRFPMGKDGPAAVTFTWKDTYANMVCSLANIRFEMISVLYNIGAIHTQLGAGTDRTSPDGMKMACTHFQCAAWAFDHLKNSYPQPPGVDLAPELMTFMYQLCLAQGQECILEKSMLDNRKPSIVAKVARQIVDYYDLALNTLEQGGSEDGTVCCDTVGSKIYKIWKRYVKFKRAYHLAVTQLYQGLAAEEQRKMGERVAFYNASLAALNEVRTLYTSAKSIMGITGTADEKEAIEDALTFTNDVIEGKRKAAKNENEYIYHEEVPEKDVLPTVKGASLVKGISFSVNDPEVSGTDIFARLVPMKVHEANSLYSEEKAKILRSVGAKIEEHDLILNTYLMSLKLENLSLWDPDAVNSESEVLPLPEELAERCAAINAKPNAIQEQVDTMTKLSDTYHNVEVMLKEINAILSEEQQREKEYQETMGKRPPSIVATDLTREAKKYEEAHAKASESNQALHRAMNLHLNNLRILSQPLSSLMAHIPSPKVNLPGESSSEKNTDNESKKIRTRKLKRILNKVDEMRRQRSELHNKLRESISQDDLTRILVTATAESEPLDNLFAEQISKHKPLVNFIEQNLVAQENILAALTEAYAQTADTRKAVDETLKRREFIISSLIASYDAYEDLLAKTTKGLEFYRKMEINVTKLLQRVKNTCKVQEEERAQILAQNITGAHAINDLSLSESKNQSHHMLPKEQSATGSGLKLKDYLANRVSNIPVYHNQFTDHRTTKTNSDQSVVKSSKTNHNGTSEGLSSTNVPQFTDPAQAYQFYQSRYPDYYPGQQSSYNTQYMYGEAVSVMSNLNASFPKTGTTFSESVYGQAGKIKAATELSSTSDTYSGYTLSQQGQIQYPTGPNTKDQYQIYSYNANTAYSYPGHQVMQENPTYQGTQVNSASPQHQNFSPVQLQSTQQGNLEAEVSRSTELNPVPYATSLNQTYSTLSDNKTNLYMPSSTHNNGEYYQSQLSESQQQPGNQNSVINPYQVGVSPQSILQQPNATQSYINPTTSQVDQQQAIPQQINPQQQVQNPQLIQNPQSVSPGIHYSLPQQYTPNQHVGMYTNTSATDSSTYSIASTNIPSANVSSNSYYDAASQYPNSLSNPQTNYSDQTQNYTNTQSQAYAVQIQDGVGTQNYGNTYGNYQQTETNVPYQNVNSNANQNLNQSYNSEIIQSHAKANSIPNYQQNYYHPQEQQYAGSSQYPTYSQGFKNSYGNATEGTVMSNSSTDSYQGHPGYGYNAVAGGYQYTSGYQNTQPMHAQEPNSSIGNLPAVRNLPPPANSNVYQQQDAYSLYTSACNNAATNQTTSSQYSNHDANSTPDNQAYYASQYGQQTPTQENAKPGYNQTYMQATNNETNTSSSGILESTEPKSNVDLLSDLDITLNHAPLLPEVQVDKSKDEKDDAKSEVKTLKDTKEVNLVRKNSTPQTDDKSDNLQIVWDTWYLDVQPKRDPLAESTILQKFVIDIEKYEKFVDSLLVKTLSGATTIDNKWKEVREFEEREDKKQPSNIATSNPAANRSASCIPYDSSRVELTSLEGPSYINASYVRDVTQWTPAAFIVTQAPKPDAFQTFWTMVWEQESEVIACLATDLQLTGDIYWPSSEEKNLTLGDFTLSLKNKVIHSTYIQRIISFSRSGHKAERIVVHMQFLVWPSNFPSSPGPLLAFATDVMSEQALRHCSPKPIIVHCLTGGSLSGLFLIATAAVCHVRAGHGIVDVPLVFSSLVKSRKGLVDKDSLLFGYRMVLYHAQDTLMKRGILSSTRPTFECFEEMKKNKGKTMRKTQHCHPSDDFLHNFTAGMQHSISSQQGCQPTSMARPSTPQSISATSQEKPDVVIDPLSQLDPLWTIRR